LADSHMYLFKPYFYSSVSMVEEKLLFLE